MTKAAKDIKKKIGQKTHDVKWKMPLATKKVCVNYKVKLCCVEKVL